MSYAFDRAAGGAAVTALLSALILLPLGGNAQGSESSAAFRLAQAQTSPARPSTPAPSARPGAGQQPASRDQQVENQLNQLRKELQITDAQQAQFDAFGQVMRSNAQAMEAAMQQQKQNPPKTAVDDLKSIEQLAGTQLDGLKRLVPAFQALYDNLSEQQKKTADNVFGRGAQEGPQPAARKK